MEDIIIIDRDLWTVITGIPAGMTQNELKKIDRKAISAIRLCLANKVIINVS